MELRCREADRLCLAGCGTAAIYLWGYATEMVLKMALFRLAGYDDTDDLSIQDRRRLEVLGRQYHITKPRNSHDLRFWADLLVQHRIRIQRPYSIWALEGEIRRRANQVYERWRETLRYRSNLAYRHEVRVVRMNAQWFLAHRDEL
jgi:hypothetical protein